MKVATLKRSLQNALAGHGINAHSTELHDEDDCQTFNKDGRTVRKEEEKPKQVLPGMGVPGAFKPPPGAMMLPGMGPKKMMVWNSRGPQFRSL